MRNSIAYRNRKELEVRAGRRSLEVAQAAMESMAAELWKSYEWCPFCREDTPFSKDYIQYHPDDCEGAAWWKLNKSWTRDGVNDEPDEEVSSVVQ